MDDHKKFTMECPDNEGSIPFLDTKCTQNPNHTRHTTVYRKPTHTDRYLDWNSNHPISAKKAYHSPHPWGKNGMLHPRAIS